MTPARCCREGQEHDEQLRLILDNVADLIAILDKNGTRLYNSPSYRKVLGDAVQLKGTDSFGEVHPDDKAPLRRVFDEVVNSGVGRRSEYRFVRGDGTIRYIESQSDVIRDASGRTDKVVVVSRDITERKRAEEDIKTAYENLKAMQADLIQSEKMASIGQFAAGIVHDLKNPLGVAANGLQLLRRMQQAGGTVDARTSELMNLSEEAIKRATTMVHDLLSLSRRDDVALTLGDLHAVVEASLAAVRHAQVPAGIELITELRASPAHVMMAADQIQQVLVNLVTNAIHAMPNGGTVRVSTAVAPVPETISRVGTRAAFFKPGEQMLVTDIADTGTGIAPEHLAKIWEPFFTTKPRGQGTGLGLAIVRSIIENHHGLIEVASEVGKGTTFRITFPLPKPATANFA